MDHRDAARRGRSDGLKPDHERQVLVDTYDEGNIGEIPAVYAVCPTCDGRGRHVNPSIDAHGISAEEFHDDPDFAEDYCSGTYDVACYGCGGKRVVLVPAANIAEEVLQELHDRSDSHYSYLAECEAERRMGA